MGLIALGAYVVAGLALYFLFKPSKPQGDDLSPASLDSFSITQASEGSMPPYIAGRMRMNGNIIWFGNLTSEAITQSSGGKGGGGQTTTVGHHYYLDIWESICLGVATIEKTWVQDAEKDISGWTEFNDGNDGTYPDEPGALANQIKGVAHWFGKQYYLGENVTYVPTIHFLMEHLMISSPVSYPNLTHGINPAALIYELYILAGVSPAEINLTDFNTAATFWNSKGYGLNIKIDRSADIDKHVGYVLSFVGGSFGRDGDNKIYITANDPDAASVATINAEEDFDKFSFTRKSWSDTQNFFVGTFVDSTKEYTKRTIRCYNPANIRLQGGKIKRRNVDLTAFRDESSASDRLWEIMKTESYPGAEISSTTSLVFSMYKVGDIVEVNSTKYGISSAEFRVVEKSVPKHDTNTVTWKLIQVVENLIDDYYQSGGSGSWSPPDYSPDPLVYQSVFELPFNPLTGTTRAYLLLAARVNSFESGFNAITSNTGVDYISRGNFSTWAQYGTLDEQYAADTIEIDDDVGILFTPYRDDPEFGSISRTDLFSRQRFCIIGSEIMRFQTYTLEGPTSVRLTGVVRGILNTAQVVHNINSPIWIFDLYDNILEGIVSDDFYVKMLPFYGATTVAAASASSVHMIPTDKAKTPPPPMSIKGVRSGSTVTITWLPTTLDYAGAGTAGPDTQTDLDPVAYDQDFQIYYSNLGTTTYEAVTSKVFTNAAQVVVDVRTRRDGFNSVWVTVTVPVSDGTYIGDLK